MESILPPGMPDATPDATRKSQSKPSIGAIADETANINLSGASSAKHELIKSNKLGTTKTDATHEFRS
jgi:hypothetical protein